MNKGIKKKASKNKKNSEKNKKEVELTKKQILKEKVKKHLKKIHPITIKERIKIMKTENKILFFSIITLFFILFVIFGARIYLLFNFILGNDTLVQLTATQQDFFVKNSETSIVEFQTYVSTNLFCEASCEYDFKDLSNGYVIDKGTFNTSLSNPHELEYSLVAPDRGEGQILYHFEVSCKSKKTTFCNTDEEEKKRSFLVAVNYVLSEEQQEFKQKSSEELQEIILETDELNKIKLENIEMEKILENIIIIDNLAKDNLSDIEEELDKKLEEWKTYNYEIVLRDDLFEDINDTRNVLVEVNNNLSNLFIDYNNIVENASTSFLELTELSKDSNVSEETYTSIESLINKFNIVAKELNEPFYIQDMEKTFETIANDIVYIKENFNKSEANFSYTILIQPEIQPIEKPFLSNYSSGRFLQTEEPMCCYMGQCEICCMDNCKNDPTKYPILLVHGHSFNDAISAESSLGDLRSIQEELTKDGVIDGGYIILSNFKNTGTFARTNKQIVFASSYYFDIYQNTENTISLQTKADSLDTYALRLNDIIENVKIMTNRDKVYIVAHSMGGLVTRRYMQIFGTEDVEKVVLIGTPNHGIDGFILSSCPIFGANIHCDSMDEDSLFINKLTYGEKPNTNVSMIIGTGCITEGSVSDGIVKNESAYLPWAKNYYVDGNCTGVNFLHQSMLDIEKYPKTYQIIKEELGIGKNL